MKTASLSEKVMSFAATLEEGIPLTADDLTDLGDRRSINRALARLADRGSLSRVARGVYVQPVEYRFGRYTPGGWETVKHLADRRGEYVSMTVGLSANMLQLTNSFPMSEAYLTSGQSREYLFDNQKIVVRHAPLWQVMFRNTMPGHVVRGLDWLGPRWTEKELTVLRREANMDDEDRRKLLGIRGMVPDWMVESLERVVANG